MGIYLILRKDFCLCRMCGLPSLRMTISMRFAVGLASHKNTASTLNAPLLYKTSRFLASC